jgi:hypothetical protein
MSNEKEELSTSPFYIKMSRFIYVIRTQASIKIFKKAAVL